MCGCAQPNLVPNPADPAWAMPLDVDILALPFIAWSILREEIGAACFNAHAHILLERTKFC
jgi:hypothetical protein